MGDDAGTVTRGTLQHTGETFTNTNSWRPSARVKVLHLISPVPALCIRLCTHLMPGMLALAASCPMVHAHARSRSVCRWRQRDLESSKRELLYHGRLRRGNDAGASIDDALAPLHYAFAAIGRPAPCFGGAPVSHGGMLTKRPAVRMMPCRGRLLLLVHKSAALELLLAFVLLAWPRAVRRPSLLTPLSGSKERGWPLGQSWPRGTGSVGPGAQGQ
jgi:hypothetical protein